MKAGVASPNGVVIQDVPEPKPKPTDILVKIKAIALNRADLGSAKGDTSHGAAAGKPIGSEFSGEVIEVGADVRDFKAGRPGDVPLARQPCRNRGQRLRPRHENPRRHGLRAGGDAADRAQHAAQRAGHRRPAQGRRERDGAGRKLRRRHHRLADRQADGREVRGRHLDQRRAPRPAQGIRRRSRRQHQGPELARAGAGGDRRQGPQPHRRHAVRPDREPDHARAPRCSAASSTSAGSPA